MALASITGSKRLVCVYQHQGWQCGTVRSEFAYYVPRTLNSTVPVHRTSVQFLKRTEPTYRTHTIAKRRTVLLSKNLGRTVLPFLF